MHRTTLEQWAILDSVVTNGNFARAASVLHRSQSSVSYNLAQLQTLLGVALLTPAGTTRLKTFGYVEARASTLQGSVWISKIIVL